MRTQRVFALTTLAAAVLALSACGGGGSGSASADSSYSSINVAIQAPSSTITNAGNSIALMATAQTPSTVIKSMTWTASDTSAVLTNASCASATKNSQTYTSNQQGATGTSQWSCPVTVTAPVGATTNTEYTLTVTVTDDKNNVKSSTQKVSFSPVPVNNNLNVNAGVSYSSTAGSTAPLHCDVTGGKSPYTYQWVISNNGGFPLTLSSFSQQDATFTVPPVATPTSFSFTCRATDANQNTGTSTVTVTGQPGAVNTNTLIANIAQPVNAITPGSSIMLDGSPTGWFGSNGSAANGPVPSYTWTSTDPNVIIAEPTAAKTAVKFPTNYSTPTPVSFTLKAVSGSQQSAATVNLLVDPNGPLSLTVTPSAISTAGNKAVSITAAATSASSSPTLYYQWTQISGNALPLGGAQTATLGVVPPLVTSGTAQYVFRVAVGYAPITPTNPGSYFADAVVTVTP